MIAYCNKLYGVMSWIKRGIWLLLLVPAGWLAVPCMAGETGSLDIGKLNKDALEFERAHKFDDAIKRRQEIYDHSVRQFGENDPDTLPALDGLIAAHRQARNYAGALKLLDKAIHLTVNTLGSSHSSVETREKNWLSVYFDWAAQDPRVAADQDKGVRAESIWHRIVVFENPGALLDKALQIDGPSLLKGSPELFSSVWYHALAIYDPICLEQLLPWFEKGLQQWRISDEDRGESADIELAAVYLLVGRPEGALPHVEKALGYSVNKSGENSVRSLFNLLHLADVHMRLGHTQEARTLYAKLARFDANRPPPDTSGFTERTPDLVGVHLGILQQSLGSGGIPEAKFKALYDNLAKERILALDDAHPFAPINFDILATYYNKPDTESKAQEYFEKALELRRKYLGHAHRDTLACLDHLGTFFLNGRHYQPDKTKALWTEAWQQRSKSLGEKHPQTLRNLKMLAVVLMEKLDQPAEAIPYLEKYTRYAIDAFGPYDGQVIGQSGSLEHLIEAYKKLGRLQDAIPYMEKRADLTIESEQREAKDPKAWRELKQTLKKAQEEHSDPTRRGHFDVDRLDDLIEAYQTLHRTEDVRGTQDRVLQLMSARVGDPAVFWDVKLYELADKYLSYGRPQHGRSLYEQALRRKLSLAEQIPLDLTPPNIDKMLSQKNAPTVAFLLPKLTVSYILLGQYELADSLITTLSRYHYRDDNRPFSFNLDDDLIKVADNYEKLEKPKDVALLLAAYVDYTEHLRTQKQFLEAAQQSYFEPKWPAVYKRLIRLYVQQGQFEGAFRIAEKVKARTLLAAAVKHQALLSGLLAANDRNRLEAIQQRLAALDRNFYESQLAGHDRKLERQYVIRQLDELHRELEPKYPEFAHLQSPRLIDVDEGRNLLPEDAAFISFAMQDDQGVALVLTREGITAKPVSVPALNDLVRHYHQLLCRPLERIDPGGSKACLSNAAEKTLWRLPDGSFTTAEEQPTGAVTADDTAALGRYLGDKLLGPVLPKLTHKKHWIIAPDGVLAEIPFEPLYLANGSMVIQEHDLSYIQSLSMYALVQSRSRQYANLPGRKPLLAMGAARYESPSEMPQSNGLPTKNTSVVHSTASDSPKMLAQNLMEQGFLGAFKDSKSLAQQIDTLSQLFPEADIYRREQATEAQLRSLNATRALTRYRYMLFAAHGYLNTKFPELNAIVLGQLDNPPDMDGFVTVNEWASFDLRSDLIVLAACETGLGEAVDGEGVMGLPFALHQAGNTNMVLSLWKVLDQSTSRFMIRFFERLKQGLSQVQALNETKREFMTTGVHSLRVYQRVLTGMQHFFNYHKQGLSFRQAFHRVCQEFRTGAFYEQPAFWAPFILYGF